jgi:hypothetical protein
MAAQITQREAEKRSRRFDRKFKKYRQLLVDRYGEDQP